MSRHIVNGYSYALGQAPDLSKYVTEYKKNTSQLEKQRRYAYGSPGLKGAALGGFTGLALATGLGIAMGLTGGFLAPIVYAAVGLAPLAIGFFQGRSLGKNADGKIDQLKEQRQAIRDKVLEKIVDTYDPGKLTGEKIHDHMQKTDARSVKNVRDDYLKAGEVAARNAFGDLDRGNMNKRDASTKQVVARLHGAPAAKV